MNETWGYKSYANKWKSIETLVRNLIDIASKGGNYLLNVGPKADGTIPTESIKGLAEIGNWMKLNGEAIYGTKGNPLSPLPWGRCTRKERDGNTTLYLSVFEWPEDGELLVPGLTNKITSVKLLVQGKALKTTNGANGLVITVPKTMPDAVATVIKLEVTGVVRRTHEVSGKR
jgi:alpha-L-fucosidase